MQLTTVVSMRLGYRFRDIKLLQEALKPRGSKRGKQKDMAFLGDRVLGLIVAEDMFIRGIKNKLDFHVPVCNETLLQHAQRLVAPVEYKMGVTFGGTIIEACLGAVMIDSNYDFDCARMAYKSILMLKDDNT